MPGGVLALVRQPALLSIFTRPPSAGFGGRAPLIRGRWGGSTRHVLAPRCHLGMEAVAAHVEVGDRLASRVELQAAGSPFFAQIKAEPSDGSEVRSPHRTESHQSLERVTHPKSRAQAKTGCCPSFSATVLASAAFIRTFSYEGSVITGEVVEDRLHEVGRHGEEASPGALVTVPGANGEKSWQGGAP